MAAISPDHGTRSTAPADQQNGARSLSDQAREVADFRRYILSAACTVEPLARLVLVAIIERMSWVTWRATVSNVTLAANTGLRFRTVQRRVQALIRDGYVTSEDKGTGQGTGRHHSLRTLTVARFARHAVQAPHDSRGDSQAPHDAHGMPETTSRGATDDTMGCHTDAPLTVRNGSLNRSGLLSGGAPAPSPDGAGSGAPRLKREREPELWDDDGLRREVSFLRSMHWTDERILAKYAKNGMTTEHLTPQPSTEDAMSESRKAEIERRRKAAASMAERFAAQAKSEEGLASKSTNDAQQRAPPRATADIAQSRNVSEGWCAVTTTRTLQ